MKIILKNGLTILALLVLLSAACTQQEETKKPEKKPTETDKSKPAEKKLFPKTISADFPTDLVFTDNKLFFTEKGGNLKVLNRGETKPMTLLTVQVPQISGYDETGLLGIALSPEFSDDQQIYLFHTVRVNSELKNRVIRVQADDPEKKPVVIIDDIKGARIHDAGKLAFGPNGNLFIATGDADEQQLAQNKNSLNGKVLRIKPDGSIPADNPFNNATWSFGHRNIFGMTFDNEGRLFVTENGPESNDEINMIKKGANYGWPNTTGDDPDFEQPLITFKSSIAPTGIIFYTGDKFKELQNKLVFGDFINGDVHRLTLQDSMATDKIVASSQGDINALAQTKDGQIYLAIQDQIKRLELSN